MIATGGLIRINARRQDSLHPKTHKKKKKRRNEVVVVKGKLRLCSVPGLVASLGILILLVGMAMSTLGYWYRDNSYFRAHGNASQAAALPQEEPEAGEQGGVQDGETAGSVGNVVNRTEYVNGTERTKSQGFLQKFIDRYLYSDNMKLIGPLIMGVGIFLFICANAVLHENRDKKTKAINLRDIYSTVIDMHQVQKPRAEPCSSTNPLNGLVNPVCPTSLLAKKGGGGGGVEEEVNNEQEERTTVFSISQEDSGQIQSWSSLALPVTGTSASSSAEPRRLSTGGSSQPRRLSTGGSSQPRRLSTGASSQPSPPGGHPH